MIKIAACQNPASSEKSTPQQNFLPTIQPLTPYSLKPFAKPVLDLLLLFLFIINLY